MLLAAPFLVRKLGMDQYGLWMLVTAILGSMGLLSGGFGDATVRYVSSYRGRNDLLGVERTIRATLAVNGILGTLCGLLVWLAAPLGRSFFTISQPLQTASIQAVRLSAIILLVRSMESVFVSTLRAFERYGPPVAFNIALRIAVVCSAVMLAALNYGVVAIMAATLLWSVVVLLLQAVAARRVAGPFKVFPSFARGPFAEVVRFGCFSWLQSLAGVSFSYADRFLVAAMLGTEQLGIYVLCVQAAQTIHGLSAAAFNFVFPHISSRYTGGNQQESGRVLRVSMLGSLGLSLGMALVLIVFGKVVLSVWMGAAFAAHAYSVLAILALAYFTLALNVVPHYTLLALGQVRFVSAVNIAGGVASLLAASALIPFFGVVGAALGRLLYGPTTALSFWRLNLEFKRVPLVKKPITV